MTNGQMCIQPTGLPLVWSEAAARNTQCADHDTAAAPKQTSCRTVGSCTHGGGVDSRWDCRPGCGGDAGSGRHRRGCGRCLCGRGWGTVVQGHDAVADVEVGEVLPCNYAPAGVTFLRRFRLPPLKHPTQPPREVNANYSLHATHVLLLQIESEGAIKKRKKKKDECNVIKTCHTSKQAFLLVLQSAQTAAPVTGANLGRGVCVWQCCLGWEHPLRSRPSQLHPKPIKIKEQ